MDTMPLEDLIGEVLQRLEREGPSFTDERIFILHDALWEGVISLRSLHNDRQRLLRLPLEMIQTILAEVRSPSVKSWKGFEPFWHSDAVDSSMLIPVTHTCRRLRYAALQLPTLWGNLHNSKVTLIPTLIQRSGHTPLHVGLSFQNDVQLILPAFNRFYGDQAYRIRELHVFHVDLSSIDYLFDVLRSSLPNLESFSLAWNALPTHDQTHLPLSHECSPRLRRLFLKDVPFLPDTGFPLLSHLAVSFDVVQAAHAAGPWANPVWFDVLEVADYLAQCPEIESVVLGDFTLSPTLPAERSPLQLPKLRQVILHHMDDYTLRYYLSVLQPHGQDTAYRILDCLPDNPAQLLHGFFDFDSFWDAPRQLCIALHSTSRDIRGLLRDYTFTITVTARGSVRRIAGDNPSPDCLPTWITQLLSSSPVSAHVHEAWIVTAESLWPRDAVEWSPQMRSALSPLTLLPSLDTAVIVVDHTFAVDGERPSLHLLPSSTHPAYTGTNLKTLRIAHGYSVYAVAQIRAQMNRVEIPTMLDLSVMLSDLATGSYGYLKHLVLQTTSHISVREADVARLQEYFDTVRVEKIEELPSMQLYGKDPMMRGFDSWSTTLA